MTLESTYTFELDLILPYHPCTITVFDAEFVLKAMEVDVKGIASTQKFAEVTDIESMERGDKDGITFCGKRVYSIKDIETYPFLNFDPIERSIVI